MIARQKLASSNNLSRYHIIRTAVARLSTESFNVIANIISHKNKGCEFAFYMCNSFCEIGNLETLVSGNLLAKEKDVAKYYIFQHLYYNRTYPILVIDLFIIHQSANQSARFHLPLKIGSFY